ncbi:BCD family MFS transporter [Moorena sp. SIO3H5]|uniref:BCD family MFS transporter n=1 Tax=Moorena sp. SIO3H5 TaxID=2607834 RepID=UPI0013BA4550|nr:BCD family MFS transporter [Moorena sp. SIO3H5]NEO71451.1 BCD family MFS transporter [Moorena sp. SIO3H5]
MKSSNVVKSEPPSLAKHHRLPNINLFTMFRLGLFQMGLGVLAVLTLGVLNRVMIDELGIPASITGSLLAISLFVAPARVWFGQLSDTKPVFGYHRTGYVWMGSGFFMIILSLAVQITWQLGNLVEGAGGWTWSIPAYSWVALGALVFALYGMAVGMSSTTFFTLLVDISDEDNRGKLIGIIWSMMTVGIAIGGISSKILLKGLDNVDASLEVLRSSITGLFFFVPLMVFGLAVLATFGIEKKYSRYSSRSILANRDDQITLGQSLKLLTASPQTGLFFTFLMIMTISIFLQEAVLEPYGGEVFNMSIPETSLLNTFWGIGMLMSLSATGFFIIPNLGKRKTTELGCLAVSICLILIIMSGFTENAKLFQGSLLLFGLSTGIASTGAVSLMLDLTAAEAAGTFVGAWGLAQAMSRGIAVASGGVILDVGRAIFTSPVLAYGVVFALQSAGMIVAIWFLGKVNFKEFQDNAKDAIAAVMEGDLDG